MARKGELTMRIDITKLPKLVEFYGVPYLVYDDTERGVRAINDFASQTGLLPEILFEGEEISRERFKKLAEQRAEGAMHPTKYEEVLDFYDRAK